MPLTVRDRQRHDEFIEPPGFDGPPAVRRTVNTLDLAIHFSLVLLACGTAFAQARNSPGGILEESWSSQQGAPEGIQALAQTSDGFLWIGSPTGLFRFDGVRFERFLPADSILSTNVNQLFTPRSGGLWIGYAFGGFSFLRDGHVKNYGGAVADATGTINRFAEGPDGVMWAATNSGIWRFEHSTWNRLETKWSAPAGRVLSIGFDRAGTLWALAGNELHYLLSGAGQFRKARGGMSVYTDFVWDADHMVLTRRVLQEPGLSSYPIVLKDAAPVVDRTNGVWIIRQLNLTWIRTSAAQPLEDIVLKPKDPETFDLIVYNHAALVDREGDVWFADQRKLHRFYYSPVRRYEVPFEVGPFAIAAGEDGAVWIGAWGGSRFFRAANGKLEALNSTETGWSLVYTAPDKTVWLGGVRFLWHLVHGDWVRVEPPEKSLDYFLQAISPDHDGGLWFSFGRHGLYRLAHGVWTPNGGRQDMPQTGVVSEFTDSFGRVWFGLTKSQVAVLDGDRVQRFGPEDGLRVGNVTAIFGRGSVIWIGGEFGLQAFDNGKTRNIAAFDDDWLSGISGIVETANGDLWLNGIAGIFHIRQAEIAKALADAHYHVRGQHLGRRDGLPGFATQIRPLPSAIEASDGRLWFAFTGGVAWIDPAHGLKAAGMPPIAIHSVTADDNTYQPVHSLKLPAHTSSVSINYSAVSLSEPEAIRFRYRLQEADLGWHETNDAHTATYRNLSPGLYHFSVDASDTEGVWSQKAASVVFTILPAWYQTLWFRASCTVMGVMLLWGLYWYRLHRLAREFNVRLEGRIAERERIARDLHDTLLQSFQGLMLRLQVVDDLLSPGEAKKELEQSLERADQAIAEGRRAVYDLRSSMTTTDDLKEALRAAAREFGGDGAPTFRLEVEGAARDLHPILRDEVYRIAREGLRNAFKHARARHVEAEITYGERVLRLRIRDDGDGISQDILESGRPGHYGLRGMRERARQNGVSLEIWSRPRAGTEIDVSIPASIVYTNSSNPSGWPWFRRRGARS